MTSYELSYATPGDPPLKRWLMRAIENLSGRRRLLPLYHRWRRESAGKSPHMWADALDLIGTRLEIDAPVDWHRQIPAGPLVMIANHPFGIADGIAMLALAERIGRPYRILLYADFMRVPELQPLGLPIDFSDTKEATAINLATRAEARRLLKQGVTIVIFPAGGVATAETPFGVAEELPWKQFVVRLIQQTHATVLPVHFEGQNSPLFHLVSHFSLMLRLSLLVSEFRHRIGATIRATVGAPVACSTITVSAGAGRDAFIDELYVLVRRLAPDARGADRAALLPRPPLERHRYPWDSLPDTTARSMSSRSSRGQISDT
jgi:putative hemolysin